MTVRYLIIEDDPSFLETIERLVAELGPDVQARVARSRDSAVAALGEDSFDLAVLDLKLPTTDGALDADVEHGRLVFQKIRGLAPGMPILVLTGSPAESFISDFLAHAKQEDVWGTGTQQTISFLRKSDLDELPGRLAATADALRAVMDVELTRSGPSFNLTWSQDRLLRIFTRRRGGRSCTVHRISSGLSDAAVFRLAMRDEVGAPFLNTVVKIAKPGILERESQGYSMYAQRLPEHATPRFIDDVRFGGGAQAAVAYKLAETHANTIFGLARDAPSRAADAVGHVWTLTEPWRQGTTQSRRTIAEVRRRLVSDQKVRRLAEEYKLDWLPTLEARGVQARWCCIHGDLHGGNLLIDRDGFPILIDYGDIGEGPASLDWVVLELSTLFHPDGCARVGDWPSLEECSVWSDVGAFSGSTVLAPFLAACRQRAQEASAGQRELAASAYAYLLRQLSYDDTDKERALALLDGVRRFVESNT